MFITFVPLVNNNLFQQNLITRVYLLFPKMKIRAKFFQNQEHTTKLSSPSQLHKQQNIQKISLLRLPKKMSFSDQKSVKLPSLKPLKIVEEQKYGLGQIIGEGAFAKVRLAHRKSDGMVCVIKSYEKCRMNSEQKRNSIFKEIQILRNISHPSIIKIIDFYETSDSFCIVMENFSSDSLATFTRQNRPLVEQTLRNITKSIAEALVYLHSSKISHRDLKPENVLINAKGEIKIIDLGLAMMGDHHEMIVAGTPQFMCPELINKKNYNPYKADIWALGILLYWLVLGYYPQDNCKKSKQLAKISFFELKFPVDMHPGIQYLIEKMLETNPEKRISAKDILEDSWIKPRNIKLEIQKLKKNNKI